MKLDKKSILIVILAIALIGVMIGGTVAWLTATSTLTNSFTVGSFNLPTTDPDAVGGADNDDIEQYLYEPSWVDTAEHKLVPGVSFDKDPYVGIGKGSEDAVVYVNITNNYSNKVYFTINDGWEAVEAEDASIVTENGENKNFTSGLFKYTAGLTNATNTDVWTEKPLFSEIVVADDANTSDLTVGQGKENQIVVSSFIHQAKDSEGSNISDADVILPAAKAAFGIQ